MTPDQITAEVEASVADWSGHASPALAELVPLAISEGIGQDADFACIVAIIDDHVHCGLVCGCTLLVGASMRWALATYFDGDGACVDAALSLMRDHAIADLQVDDVSIGVLRGDHDGWRSFRGERLPSFAEVLASARCEWN